MAADLESEQNESAAPTSAAFAPYLHCNLLHPGKLLGSPVVAVHAKHFQPHVFHSSLKAESTMNRFVPHLTLALCLPFTSLARAADPTLADVLQSCPKTANAVLHGDFVAIRKLASGTPLESDLPSGVSGARIAAEINLGSLQPEWEIGYAVVPQMPAPDAIAQRAAGYVDNIGGRAAVWTPNQMYLIPLQNNILSIVRPADRKFVGQWLKKDRANTVSDYLLRAAASPLDQLSTLIAFDLEDVVSADVLAQGLSQFKSVENRDLAAIAKTLASVQGVTLSVRKDSLQNATISLQFRQGSRDFAAVAKSFFLEAMARRGTSLPELASWNQSNSPDLQTITFSGTLSAQALDDVLGIFTVHQHGGDMNASSPAAAATAPAANSAEASASMIAENTKDYFKKLVNIVHRVRDYSANNTGERAQWNGNMANRIDMLPTLNIDPDMVNFGAEVAKALRTNMVSMQTINISQGAAAVASDAGTAGFSTATAGGTWAGGVSRTLSNYGYGYSAGGFVDPNSPTKYYQLGQAQGNSGFKQMMAQLEQALADMRRTMTDRYKIQF